MFFRYLIQPSHNFMGLSRALFGVNLAGFHCVMKEISCCLSLFVVLTTACGSDPKPPDGGGTDAGLPLVCIDPGSDFSWPTALAAVEISPSSSWSNRISSDSQLLTGDERTPILWSKWSAILSEPDSIYFQDSKSDSFPFHYDFAHAKLDPFLDISRPDFNAITLHTEGQKIALGAVLFPTQSTRNEYGVQIVSQDPLHPEFIKELFLNVAASVDAKEAQPVFLPIGKQAVCAKTYEDWYTAEGIAIGSMDDWLPGDQCYSQGWAVGRVVSLAASEIEAAVLSGELTAEDILLLQDTAPAELPAVAGILTLQPSTPNSHTAILAQSYGIPFAYLRLQASSEKILSLVGKTVVMGTGREERCSFEAFDLSAVNAEIVAELRSMREPGALQYTPKSQRGSLTVPIGSVRPTDIASVGGKAGNYGLLHSVLPQNSRPAIALTMDLWDGFLAQTLPGGGTLSAAIDQRLGGFTWPPAMAELDTALKEVRDLIRDTAQFSPDQKSSVVTALSEFDASKKLRFRSSTNVEDGDTFTGAGLYASASGCLADDTDGDDLGPSRCNQNKAEERGVFRAIQKVYASFYRRNAFVERLRRGVREEQVGMAVLVHHSFPDRDEMANGVGVLKAGTGGEITLVSQPGAVSVTNPEGGALPEIYSGTWFNSSVFISKTQSASLLPLGASVLSSSEEYQELVGLFLQVLDTLQSGTEAIALDFEYKKITPGDLLIKQVRRLPLADVRADVEPLLLDSPVTLCVLEGENSDVFAIHRLKSEWTLRNRTTWLDEEGLSTSLITTTELEYVDGAGLASESGALNAFPGYEFKRNGDFSEDQFSVGSADTRVFTLLQEHPALRRRSEIPALVLDGLVVFVQANYSTAQPFIGFGDGTREEESVLLTTHCPDSYVLTDQDVFQERSLQFGAVSIETSFYWPPFPEGPTAGYTAPLQAWKETVITGLTGLPIVLKSTWSQSQRPDHHNFGASYLFEPRLEPGISSAIVDELNAANIKMIYANEGGVLQVVGLDNRIRSL